MYASRLLLSDEFGSRSDGGIIRFFFLLVTFLCFHSIYIYIFCIIDAWPNIDCLNSILMGSEGFTGAELKNLCNQAGLRAILRAGSAKNVDVMIIILFYFSFF